MVTAEAYHMFEMFYSREKSISRKNLALPRNAIMWQHLIIQFSFYYLSSGRLREVKNNRKFQTFSAYEMWSLTRGSKYSDLTWKLLVFWKTCPWGEVVAIGGSTVWLITNIATYMHNSCKTSERYAGNYGGLEGTSTVFFIRDFFFWSVTFFSSATFFYLRHIFICNLFFHPRLFLSVPLFFYLRLFFYPTLFFCVTLLIVFGSGLLCGDLKTAFQ